MSYLAKVSFVLLSLLLMMAFTPASQQPSAAAAAGPPDDLERLHQRMLPVFEIEGVIFTDANEQTNRLVVAVQNKGLARSVEQRLGALGIPLELVDIVESEPFLELATLRDKIRPVESGLQAQFGNYVCTTGAIAVREGVLGLLFNQHCRVKKGTTQYYQPDSTNSSNWIATQFYTPQDIKGNGKNGCPRGLVCSDADVLFAKFADGVPADLGKIAKTASINTGDLSIDGQFQIAGKGSAIIGDVADKVGRTTGDSQGPVTATCVDVRVSGTHILQKCQTFVSAAVGGGDSSSSVFIRKGLDLVDYVGILWGGNTSGTQFVYSPVSNIEKELGTITITP